jgi:NAD-dependent SIR2 family protein deacetylase
MNDNNVRLAAALIRQAEGLVIAAGAGMGVDSGLPDFRGNEGFWQAYPALKHAGIHFPDIACPAAFRSTPLVAWGFYGHRLSRYRRIQPHPGFALLKQWGEAMPHGYSVFTSNVDGQFQKAGFDPARIHECHGSLHHLQCLRPCSDDIWSADGFHPEVNEETCELRNAAPRCPRCGGIARPAVLMFGDAEWIESRQRLQEMRQEEWLCSVRRPVAIEVGAGTTIPSVRYFSQCIVQDFDGRLIRINPRQFSVPTHWGVGLAMGALQGLTAIAAALQD